MLSILKRFTLDQPDLTKKVLSMDTEDGLDHMNKKMVEYLSDYPSPTISHLQCIMFGNNIKEAIETFVKLNPKYAEWWENKQKTNEITEYDFKYSFGTLDPETNIIDFGDNKQQMVPK